MNNGSNFGDKAFEGKSVKIEGVSSFNGGEFDDVTIKGVISVSGEIKANKVKIGGVVTASQRIETIDLDVSGVTNLDGALRTKNANISGVVNMGCDKFESDVIKCSGVISSKGEIYADTINADGCISANELYGDDIKIYSRKTINKIVSKINSLFDTFPKKYASHINTIEATTITLEGTKCKKVSGHDVTIGKDCFIENLDCDGNLTIDASSEVQNITGNYTSKDKL